jgi:hypothetical protein
MEENDHKRRSTEEGEEEVFICHHHFVGVIGES